MRILTFITALLFSAMAVSGSLSLSATSSKELDLSVPYKEYYIRVNLPQGTEPSDDLAINVFEGAFRSIEKRLQEVYPDITLEKTGPIEKRRTFKYELMAAVEPQPQNFATSFKMPIRVDFSFLKAGTDIEFFLDLKAKSKSALYDFLSTANVIEFWHNGLQSPITTIPQDLVFWETKKPTFESLKDLGEIQMTSYKESYSALLSELKAEVTEKCEIVLKDKKPCSMEGADFEIEDRFYESYGDYFVEMHLKMRWSQD